MNAQIRFTERDSALGQHAFVGATWENESGPEGALTPTPALTPHHSINPRSEG